MCDICGKVSCANWMHSSEEQEKYAKVIDAFDRARELREQVRHADADEGKEQGT